VTVIIPWQAGPAFQQQVTLERVLYTFRARFNAESGFWTLDILDRNREPLVTGIRLVMGQALLRNCRTPKAPPGELVLVGQGVPDLGGMGNGVQLAYVPSGDLP